MEKKRIAEAYEIREEETLKRRLTGGSREVSTVQKLSNYLNEIRDIFAEQIGTNDLRQLATFVQDATSLVELGAGTGRLAAAGCPCKSVCGCQDQCTNECNNQCSCNGGHCSCETQCPCKKVDDVHGIDERVLDPLQLWNYYRLAPRIRWQPNVPEAALVES